MKKTLSVILSMMLCMFTVFAQEAEAAETTANEVSTGTHNFWINVAAAYYPGAANLLDSGTNWAGIDSANYGLEGAITPWYEYKVNTPGNNALTAGNNVKFQTGLELTPVSLMARGKIVYTPIAFLQFSAGTSIGTGWDLGSFKGGMAVWNGSEYAADVPFMNLFFEPWIEGLFQFDVAALLPQEKQDWMHIALVATYKVLYTSLSGVGDGTAWKWQCSGNKFNGWNYYSCITLGYIFPKQVKALSLAGVQVEFDGYFGSASLAQYAAYDPTFMRIGINPTLVFNFNKHNSLAVQGRIRDRRSFATSDANGTVDTSFNGTMNGIEWYFDRIALSYTYTF